MRDHCCPEKRKRGAQSENLERLTQSGSSSEVDIVYTACNAAYPTYYLTPWYEHHGTGWSSKLKEDMMKTRETSVKHEQLQVYHFKGSLQEFEWQFNDGFFQQKFPTC